VFKETRGISVVAVDREAHTAPAATGATVQESLAGSPVRTEA
jgi:hypothetical protein